MNKKEWDRRVVDCFIGWTSIEDLWISFYIIWNGRFNKA